MTETFPDIAPSRGSGFGPIRPKIKKAAFGDNYEQTAADGLNTERRMYRAVFEARENADIETIRAFLSARGGHEPFEFTPPGMGDAVKWRCEEWDGPIWESATHSTLRATFIEDFSL